MFVCMLHWFPQHQLFPTDIDSLEESMYFQHKHQVYIVFWGRLMCFQTGGTLTVAVPLYRLPTVSISFWRYDCKQKKKPLKLLCRDLPSWQFSQLIFSSQKVPFHWALLSKNAMILVPLHWCDLCWFFCILSCRWEIVPLVCDDFCF